MAETATKLRLVRCPKCENLLPELPNLPIYQCGGCGAVLQAKKQSSRSDGSSVKSDEGGVRVISDEESIRMSSEKLESSSFDKGETVNLSDTSEISDRESHRVSQERSLQETSSVLNKDSSSSKTENMATSTYFPRNVGGHGSKYSRSSRDLNEKQVVGNGHYMNKDKSVSVDIEKETREFNPQIGAASRYRRSRQLPDYQSVERDQRTPRTVVDEMKISASYTGEGPSNYHPGSSYGNGGLMSNQKSQNGPDRVASYGNGGLMSNQKTQDGPDRVTSYGNGGLMSNQKPQDGPDRVASYGNGGLMSNQKTQDGPDRVEYLEKDRAELLRKLDELKDQISRSCDISEQVKERVPLNGRTVPPVPYVGHNWFPDGTSRSEQVPLHSFPAEQQHLGKPSYVSHGHEPVPLLRRHERDMQNFYPLPLHASNDRQGYGDPFGSEMLGRPQNQPFGQYPQQSSHNYFSGQYRDIDPEHVSSYPHNTFFHQPACSCSHCYNKGLQAPNQAPHFIYPNRRFSEASTTNPMFYHHEDPHVFGSRSYNPRSSDPSFHSRQRQTRPARQTGIDTEIGGFGRSRLQRVVLPKRNARRCHPIAGGAPFITCHNCFQLLPLPRKLSLMKKNKKKLQCGACSTVISVAIESNRLVVSVPTQTKEVPPLDVNDNSAEIAKGGFLISHGHSNQDKMKSYSDDYDNSACNFLSMDAEASFTAMDQRLNSSESEKIQGFLSSSSSTYEDDGSPESLNVQREASSSAELPMQENATPQQDSPIREHSSDQLVSKFGKGNRSKRTDQEKVFTARTNSRQNSVKDAAVATEMDVSFNEYTAMSQDSGQATREENRSRTVKGGSFFVGLIKKSFRDFSRSHQTENNDEPHVTVNGHPIPERLVRKAEKQAGPIHPGEYWYDSRAGFWGVMGQPCLGIIPPFIEELNYPIPKSCAGGNTGVFVNGRELNRKDLDLLANRGLPTARDKSYILEMSGRILDEDTGEELDSLGKLAPTVERVKRGFGMKDPTCLDR